MNDIKRLLVSSSKSNKDGVRRVVGLVEAIQYLKTEWNSENIKNISFSTRKDI